MDSRARTPTHTYTDAHVHTKNQIQSRFTSISLEFELLAADQCGLCKIHPNLTPATQMITESKGSRLPANLRFGL